MNKKTRKNILNVLFLITLMVITIWAVLGDQDFDGILEQVRSISPIFLCIGFILVILYVCGESVIIKYLLHTVHIKAPILDCIRYSFVGFFYSCITPSASGGQPMQIYYMKKRKIDIPTASIILLLVTIEYKFVLVFIGVALILFGQCLLADMSGYVHICLYIGLALNVICVSGMSLLVFKAATAKTLITKGFSFLKKIHLMKEKNNRSERLERSMNVYQSASVYLKKTAKAIVVTTLLSFVQRAFYFLITYVVYRSLGCSEVNAFTIVLLQAIISISVDMLPLPGGMGISEILYPQVFGKVFTTETMLTASLLVSRGFNYYILVIVSGLISLITHITIRGETADKT